MMKTKTTTDIQTRTTSRNLQAGARENKDSTQDTGKPHIALVLGCESKNVRNRTIGYKFLEF